MIGLEAGYRAPHLFGMNLSNLSLSSMNSSREYRR